MKALIAAQIDFFGLTRRDAICLGLAVGLHSLLLLWTASPLKLLDEQNKDLGETIVQVEFRSDADAFFRPSARSKKRKGFMSRVSSFFKKAPAKKRQEQTLSAAHDQSDQIKIKKNPWESVKNALSNKDFKKKDFQMTSKSNQDMAISKGGNQKLADQKIQMPKDNNSPSLKSKTFRIAKKDAPFKLVKPKREDSLSMTNTVPINVGRKTSTTIKSFKDLDSGPQLSGKSFSSGKNKGSGFGSLASGTRSSGGKIATGGGLPSGLSKGTSKKIATSKSYSGSGTGFGSARRGAASKSSAVEKQLSATGTPSGRGSGFGRGKNPFSIEGALRHRKIVSKAFPKAKMDGRVALRFRVDYKGSVLDGVVVVISSGSPSFDREVVAALKKWTFRQLPAQRSNEIQEGVITFVFRGV